MSFLREQRFHCRKVKVDSGYISVCPRTFPLPLRRLERKAIRKLSRTSRCDRFLSTNPLTTNPLTNSTAVWNGCGNSYARLRSSSQCASENRDNSWRHGRRPTARCQQGLAVSLYCTVLKLFQCFDWKDLKLGHRVHNTLPCPVFADSHVDW